MKAEIKETGKLVNVINLYDDGTAELEDNSYIKVSKLNFEDFNGCINFLPSHAIVLNSEKTIDWEQRRYELAKTALAGINVHDGVMKIVDDVNLAIRYADEMIKQLKNE